MAFVTISDIKRILILGSGTMGRQIGFLCALHGYQVMLYDNSRQALDEALHSIERLSSRSAARGTIGPEQPEKIRSLISSTTDASEAAEEADLISESLPENPLLKGEVFAQFNKLCPERTIFTTNTSTLVPSMFADQTGRPEKFLALHFHDVRTTKVVDVMPHPGTSPEAVELVCGFARRLHQVVIMVKREHSGYVFNTMLSGLFQSALTLASTEVASVEDIDRAWMGVMGTPVGPFGIMDQVGISTVWTIVDYWAKQTGDVQTLANATFLKRFVESGLLGAKTQKGFYDYPKPSYRDPEFVSGSAEANTTAQE
jgi:3-hydroxybutyryl-CoA dehydrogenase